MVKTLSRRRRTSKRSGLSSLLVKCLRTLKRKIGVNLKEAKRGRYSSKAQALAVSYSQTKKARPACAKYLVRRPITTYRKSHRSK